MYTCMCMYRERKRETRNSGRESKSQSFRWSLRVNKQETREDIEGNVFHWFEKNHWHLRLSRWRQLTHLISWPHQSRQWPYCAGAPSLDHVGQEECSWGLAYCEDRKAWRRLVPGEDWHAQGQLRYNFFENTRSQKFHTSVPKTKCTQHTWVYPQGRRPWPLRKLVMWIPSPKHLSNRPWCPPESWRHGERQ